MQHNVDDAVRRVLGRTTPPPLVSVLCVTRRPHRLEHVLAAYEQQSWSARELVVVIHGDVDLEATRERVREIAPVQVLSADPERSLGWCLNLGLAQATARFVARWDDDDSYGPHYLADAMLAHRFAEAGVVGKHTTYVWFEQSAQLWLRFPGHEFTYTGYVAGATFVIDRERTGGISFPDVSTGEDSGFLRACEAAGIPIYSADRFGFVMRRSHDHTWSIGDADLQRRSVRIDAPEGPSFAML